MKMLMSRDDDKYLIGVYEKIGVFEDFETWYTSAKNMLDATNFRDDLEKWQTAKVTIFNLSHWPHSGRVNYRTLEEK